MFNKKHKSQAFLIYAALIAIVATMLIIMAPYIMGRISGVYKAAGDAFYL